MSDTLHPSGIGRAQTPCSVAKSRSELTATLDPWAERLTTAGSLGAVTRALPSLLAASLLIVACSGEPATTTTGIDASPAEAGLEAQLMERVNSERWDANCLALLDEAIDLAQGVIDLADPLTPEEVAAQADALTADFDPQQADLAARFSELECSQFWWDVTLLERSEDLRSTSVAGFVTKFGFLETSIVNVAEEYGPAVGLVLDAPPGPAPLQPEPPNLGSCQDVFEALLEFQAYQVDLADHLATLPATPPPGYAEFATEYSAATQQYADANGCEAVGAAEYIILNEQRLDPDNVYGSFAKYFAFAALLRQAEFD